MSKTTTVTVISKFLHSGSPKPSLVSLSSCSYSIRRSHTDCQYVTVPPFQSSPYKSVQHFRHSFALDAPKIWNGLPDNVYNATSIASIRKKLKTYVFAKSLSAIAIPLPLCCLLYGLAMLCGLIRIMLSCSLESLN